MQRDFRQSTLYQEAQALFEAVRQPGTGQISDAAEVHASPNGQQAVFTATLMDGLEGVPPTRICQIDLKSSATRVLTFGPNADRLPKYSPDGRMVAFLSDRRKADNFQLYLLDPVSGAARPAPPVEGCWVEYLHWSPDGSRILLGTAGHGADISGGEGAVASQQVAGNLPSWMPAVETGEESYRWRRAWVYDLNTDRLRRVSAPESNVWEAVWCGNEALAAVVSSGPKEGLWYRARLQITEIETGESRTVYTPKDQLGWPAASPSGKYLAVVEAVCSDRWIVAGDLRLIDIRTAKSEPVETNGVDITYTEWRSDQHLLLAGHRGFQTVVGCFDTASGVFREVWESSDLTTGGRYATASGLNETGDCVLVGEGFLSAPAIGVICHGEYKAVRSFDVGYSQQASVIGAVERLRWPAPDELEIQGWLLRPKSKGPHPLVMCIHGGPVWHWRPRWLGRARDASVLMLLKRGYAVLFPNPRGSSGRGQAFARHVLGDMGGADTYDYLSGLDHVVRLGIADPMRLGVTGLSYGGFMTAWLITQDPRFAAAVPVSPVTNFVTEHLISNIPDWVALFLADTYTNPGGRYFQRSPIMYAHNAKTPTLNICGALDRCTPPAEAMQFHNALLQQEVKSILVTYPEEGHGVYTWPAAIDHAARIVYWFELNMPATGDH